MNTKKPRIVLSSQSPRRIALLKEMGIEFTTHPSAVDERLIEAHSPREFAMKAAYLKAQDVASHYDEAIIIAADTVVVIDDRILGKPADAADARRMLETLSGRKHRVITAVAVCNSHTGNVLLDTESTDVYFKILSPGEIDDYIRSGDPLDKAGAYGIQTIGERFVEKIEGDYHNVVGFPINKVKEILEIFLPPKSAEDK